MRLKKPLEIIAMQLLLAAENPDRVNGRHDGA